MTTINIKQQIAIIERHLKTSDEYVERASSIGDEAENLTIACQSYSIALTALLNIVKLQDRLLDQVFSNRE